MALVSLLFSFLLCTRPHMEVFRLCRMRAAKIPKVRCELGGKKVCHLLNFITEGGQKEMFKTESGRIFGYARVSFTEQNLDRQIQALSKYVDEENIITDK